MNELKIFENPEFGKVRTVPIDGEPWLVGKDVARALGYSNTKDALIRHVEDEDKRGSRIPTPSGVQDMTIINESGVYSLIFSSKLPSAKKFKRWVTSEVLPALRKAGSYTIQNEVRVIPKREPEVSLSGLARVAAAARKAVLDTGGTRFEAGMEVLSILDYYGLPVPQWVKRESHKCLGGISINLEDFL